MSIEMEELSVEDDFRSRFDKKGVLSWDLNREDGRLSPDAFAFLQKQDPARLRAALLDLVRDLNAVPHLRAKDPTLLLDLETERGAAAELALRAIRVTQAPEKYELGYLQDTAKALIQVVQDPSQYERVRTGLVGAWKGAVDRTIPDLASRGFNVNLEDPQSISTYVGIHPYPTPNPVHSQGYREAIWDFHGLFNAANTGFRFHNEGRSLWAGR